MMNKFARKVLSLPEFKGYRVAKTTDYSVTIERVKKNGDVETVVVYASYVM